MGKWSSPLFFSQGGRSTLQSNSYLYGESVCRTCCLTVCLSVCCLCFDNGDDLCHSYLLISGYEWVSDCVGVCVAMYTHVCLRVCVRERERRRERERERERERVFIAMRSSAVPARCGGGGRGVWRRCQVQHLHALRQQQCAVCVCVCVRLHVTVCSSGKYIYASAVVSYFKGYLCLIWISH